MTREQEAQFVIDMVAKALNFKADFSEPQFFENGNVGVMVTTRYVRKTVRKSFNTHAKIKWIEPKAGGFRVVFRPRFEVEGVQV